MPETNELLAKLAVALDQSLNVIVALRLAVTTKAGMTDSLKTATNEALQNLSALAETVNEAIGPPLKNSAAAQSPH